METGKTFCSKQLKKKRESLNEQMKMLQNKMKQIEIERSGKEEQLKITHQKGVIERQESRLDNLKTEIKSARTQHRYFEEKGARKKILNKRAELELEEKERMKKELEMRAEALENSVKEKKKEMVRIATEARITLPDGIIDIPSVVETDNQDEEVGEVDNELLTECKDEYNLGYITSMSKKSRKKKSSVIFLKLNWNSKNFKFKLSKNDSILELRLKCHQLTGVTPKNQEFIGLSSSGEELDDSEVIHKYNKSKKIIFRMIGSVDEWVDGKDSHGVINDTSTVIEEYRSVAKGKYKKAKSEGFGGAKFEQVDRLSSIQPLKGEKYRDFSDRLVSKLSYNSNSINLIRVIYTWVHENIKYDYDSVLNAGSNRKFQYSSDYTFRIRKGVCVGISNLFKDMVNHVCKEFNVRARVVEGISKLDSRCLFTTGKIGRGHAWNSILINDETYLCDVTKGGEECFMMKEEYMAHLYLELMGSESEDFTEFSGSPIFHPAWFHKRLKFHHEKSPFFAYCNTKNVKDIKRNEEEEIVVISGEDRLDRVSCRIKYKDDLRRNASMEDRKLGVSYKKLSVNKEGNEFRVKVPVAENPYRKRFGIVQLFCDGSIVWEFLLIF